MEKHPIFCIWNPTEKTLKGFQMLRDVLAKCATRIRNIHSPETKSRAKRDHKHFQHQYLFNALLNGSQKQPLGSLSLGLPNPSKLPRR
jgi:hypothetical protein